MIQQTKKKDKETNKVNSLGLRRTAAEAAKAELKPHADTGVNKQRVAPRATCHELRKYNT